MKAWNDFEARRGMDLHLSSPLFPAMAVSRLVLGALGDPDRSDWPISTVVIVLPSGAVVTAYVWAFRSVRALRGWGRRDRWTIVESRLRSQLGGVQDEVDCSSRFVRYEMFLVE